MPNKKGGKKFKKGKKSSNHFSKKLILKNEGDDVEDQEYGKIVKVSGGGRFRVFCFDGKERMGTVCGQMRKRVWVKSDDIVLICKWTGIQDEKCTIVHKYDSDEAHKLQSMGEFPESIQIQEISEFEEVVQGPDDIFDRGPQIPESSDEESEESDEVNLDDI